MSLLLSLERSVCPYFCFFSVGNGELYGFVSIVCGVVSLEILRGLQLTLKLSSFLGGTVPND